MSHVKFFGVKDTGTPANSIVGSGFQAPYLTDVSGDPLRYPVWFSFDDLIRFVWKAKTWKLNATDFSFTAGSQTQNLPTGVLLGGSFSAGGATVDELDLIYQGSGVSGPAVSCNFVGFFFPNFFTMFSNGVRQPAIYNDGTHLFPALEILLGGIDVNDGGSHLNMDISSFPNPGYSFLCNATIEGTNVPLYYIINTNTGTTSFTASQLEILIDTTWPYT